MEASIKEFLKSALGDYLTGLGQLDRQSLSEPLTLRNVRLKRNAINEDLEATEVPLTVHNGEIGALTLNMNWRGQITFVAENVDAYFSMNTLMMARPAADVLGKGSLDMLPPALLYDGKQSPEAPIFCRLHNTSEQRKKQDEAAFRECQECKQLMSTNYETFTVCPPCARRTQRCMICGDSCQENGHRAPALPAAAAARGLHEGDRAEGFVQGEWHACTIRTVRPGEAGKYAVVWWDNTMTERVDANAVRPVPVVDPEMQRQPWDLPVSPPDSPERGARLAEIRQAPMHADEIRPRGIRGRFKQRTLPQLCGLNFGWLQQGCFSGP